MTKPSILTLSRQEIVDRLDREARVRLGMTVEEFLRKYRAGALHDPGEVADLIALANLLVEDDPLFAAA